MDLSFRPRLEDEAPTPKTFAMTFRKNFGGEEVKEDDEEADESEFLIVEVDSEVFIVDEEDFSIFLLFRFFFLGDDGDGDTCFSIVVFNITLVTAGGFDLPTLSNDKFVKVSLRTR